MARKIIKTFHPRDIISYNGFKEVKYTMDPNKNLIWNLLFKKPLNKKGETLFSKPSFLADTFAEELGYKTFSARVSFTYAMKCPEHPRFLKLNKDMVKIIEREIRKRLSKIKNPLEDPQIIIDDLHRAVHMVNYKHDLIKKARNAARKLTTQNKKKDRTTATRPTKHNHAAQQAAQTNAL